MPTPEEIEALLASDEYKEAMRSVDWRAVVGNAADNTISNLTGNVFAEELRDKRIRQGAGQGDLDLDFSAFEDEGFFDRIINQVRDQLGGVGDELSDPRFIADLVRTNLHSGQINEAQAIATLMDKLGISYDAAQSKVEVWEKDFVSHTRGGAGGDDALSDWDALMADLFGDLGGTGGGRGGRGGGGRAAPIYRGPDSGLVQDWVKSQLVNLVGRADGDRIAMLAEKYFDADRRAFGGESIDPKQTVREAIREFDDYKRIHANRTDMDDEDTWISGQYSQLLNAGVSGQEAEKLAIDFAQAGVAKVRAGELSEARRVGSAPIGALPGFFNQVRQSLSTVARSVR